MGIKFDEKTGKWRAWYSKRHSITGVPVGRRRKGIDSKVKAKKVERELIVEVHDLIQQQVVPGWEQVVTEYRNVRLEIGQTRNTALNYFHLLKKNTFERWEGLRVDQISSGHIRDLINNELSKFSVSHRRNVSKFINSTFKYCIEAGYIKSNPMPSIRFKEENKIMKVLTESEARQLLNKAKEMSFFWYPHWVLAIYTGMRNGELYALAWDQVSFENRLILVNRSWTSKDGFKGTKSGDDRHVEIAPNVLPVLKELKVAGVGGQFVLPRHPKWDKCNQAEVLRTFLAGVGLPQVRFHDLRATWATIMLSQGVAPIKVMVMGGWKSLKTMQIYIRKAGVGIKGITDHLDLHDPVVRNARVLNFSQPEKSSD